MQRRSRTAEFKCINYSIFIHCLHKISGSDGMPATAHMKTHQHYFHSTIVSIFGLMYINIWGVLNVYFGTSEASQN